MCCGVYGEGVCGGRGGISEVAKVVVAKYVVGSGCGGYVVDDGAADVASTSTGLVVRW